MTIPEQPWAIIPGNHDGVHRGHQHLLRTARELHPDLPIVPLFFEPHPYQYFNKTTTFIPISRLERRAELLRRSGADHVVKYRFDQDIASMSPEHFVGEVLQRQLGARAVIVGPDFRFGENRGGDLCTLRELGDSHGFDVHCVQALHDENQRVSSSAIRKQLGEGNVCAAARFLGRFHEIEGTVQEGEQQGRRLGFPTANLADLESLLPLDGVYAALVRRLDNSDARLCSAAVHIGPRPTLGLERSVEVHLIKQKMEYDALYGTRLRVALVERLRGLQRFDGPEPLIRQIDKDIVQATGFAEDAAMDKGKVSWLYPD